MRMMPSKYAAKAQPVTVKKGGKAAIAHVTAPLKGLSLSTALTTGDPLKATILDNWVLDEDKIRCRNGTQLVYTHPDGKPVETLVPYYGIPSSLALATNGKLTTQGGTTLNSGFLSNDWSWSSFSNLGASTYTVGVNGKDGVWSWDGTAIPTGVLAAVAVTKLTKANPAVCTVAAADIAKFKNGDYVTIAGGTGAGMVNANGPHIITSVGTPVNTFTLIGIDTTAAAADQTTGVTAVPAMSGSLVKETVLAPTSATWVDTSRLSIIMSHMNRLWFADDSNLAVYYLPVQQKSGTLLLLPVNSLFKRGGAIRAIYTWSMDGGAGMDDRLCIFSTNGEVAIYRGVDPATDFTLIGVFRFDAPMSKNCVSNYGGDLYILISTGLVPMSQMIQMQIEQQGFSDKNVFSAFMDASRRFRAQAGWQLQIDSGTGRMICNMPQGGTNVYKQMVRFMPNQYWTSWSALPSRCWAYINSQLWFGDDKGHLYAMSRSYLTDAGKPIQVDVQFAWANFGSAGVKHFKMLKPYIITDGRPRPMIDMQVDYQIRGAQNQPDLSFSPGGAAWDTAQWNTAQWAPPSQMVGKWSGIGRLGTVGAPRLVAQISGCEFALSGIDVLYEPGSVMG